MPTKIAANKTSRAIIVISFEVFILDIQKGRSGYQQSSWTFPCLSTPPYEVHLT